MRGLLMMLAVLFVSESYSQETLLFNSNPDAHKEALNNQPQIVSIFQSVHANISIATTLANPMSGIRDQMVPSAVTTGTVQMNLFVIDAQEGVTFQNSLESALTQLSQYDNKNWYSYFVKYLNKLSETSALLAECAKTECEPEDFSDLMYETQHYLNRISHIIGAVNSGSYKNQNPSLMWGAEDFYHIHLAGF